MTIHEKYMARCIKLAKNGLGTTGTNPLVGCVLVVNDTIIGEGWHYKAGLPHAEVNAINSVKEVNRALISKATIYVSLEPCSHYGKTPPCSDLIISSGIKKVVIGTIDPFAKVAGRGVAKLKDAACEVITGVLVAECEQLNKHFFTYHRYKRPFVTLKWAQTADGFIAPDYTDFDFKDRAPVWISDVFSKQWAHKLRAQNQAILVGTNTVIKDNPSLNTRLWYGANPLRIVLDLHHKIPAESNIFTDGLPTVIITLSQKKAPQENAKNVTYEVVASVKNIVQEILDVLYRYQIHSLIVEGGKQVLDTFIDANLWDEALVVTGQQVFFKKGLTAPVINRKGMVTKINSNHTLTQFTND